MIKYLISIFLISFITCAEIIPEKEQNLKIQPSQAKDFAIGFFTGMGATAIPDAFDCINLITKTIDSLENIKELSDLLNIIKDLKDKAVVCENTADEGSQVYIDIANGFSNPVVIAQNIFKLVENKSKVTEDIASGNEQQIQINQIKQWIIFHWRTQIWRYCKNLSLLIYNLNQQQMSEIQRNQKIEKFKDIAMESFIQQIENNEKQQTYIPIQKESLTTIKNIIFSSPENYPFKIDFDFVISFFNQLQVKKIMALQEIQKKIDFATYLDESQKLAEVLFWFIFSIAYPEQCNDREYIMTFLRNQANQMYFKIVKTVQNDIVMSILIFHLSYIVNLAFYIYFNGSRQQFNNKFITNVYVIILKELNGIDSSYLYLKSSLEKHFHMNYFLNYKKEKKKDFVPLKVLDVPIQLNNINNTQSQFFHDLNQHILPCISKRNHHQPQKVDQFMLLIFKSEQINLVLKAQEILRNFLIVCKFPQLFKICLKQQQLPDKQNRRNIKHHQYSNQKEMEFKEKIGLIKQEKNQNNQRQSLQQQSTHNQLSSNYNRYQLFNINSKQLDQAFNIKYPQYQQFFQEEIELKQILNKNDMRMTDLKSSKQAIKEFDFNKDYYKKKQLEQMKPQTKQSLNINDDFIQNLRYDFDKKMNQQSEIKKTQSMANLQIDQSGLMNSIKIEEPQKKEDKKLLIKLKDRHIVNDITNSLAEVQTIIKKNDTKLTESQQMKEDYQTFILQLSKR